MQADSQRHDKWRRYYEQTGSRPPRTTLLFALERFEAELGPAAGGLRAVDLGCGNGRDTLELLRRGWSVLAIDAEPSALESLQARSDLPPRADLECRLARFEDSSWTPVHLVNASFALPLCPRERFFRLWQQIVATLLPGGRFCGQLYGERDDWAGDATLTHLTREELDALLADLEVEFFQEEEEDSVTPRGQPKHWHIFHIVARKP